MKKWIYIFTLLIVSCTKSTDEKSHNLQPDYVFPFDKESFDWTTVEKTIDTKEKVKFGEARPWLKSMYADSYLDNIHALDVNDDGQMDLIYSGPGPVTEYTIISIGNKSDDFSFDGYVIDLEIQEGKLNRLYLTSVVGTGAPVVAGQTIVDISFKGDRPIFKTSFNNEIIQGTKMPKQKVSYEIETTLDTLVARKTPLELDTPYNYVLEIEGNRLGLLTKGTKARVIGEHIDSLKNLWLCALIYPEYRIVRYPYMNMEFDSTDRTTRMVWVKNKGLRRSN